MQTHQRTQTIFLRSILIYFFHIYIHSTVSPSIHLCVFQLAAAVAAIPPFTSYIIKYDITEIYLNPIELERANRIQSMKHTHANRVIVKKKIKPTNSYWQLLSVSIHSITNFLYSFSQKNSKNLFGFSLLVCAARRIIIPT